VIHVEPVQFTVGRQVDAGLPLKVEHHAGGVQQRLLARQGGQPVGDRIRSDRRRQNPRRLLHDGSIPQLSW
jgi:hypothetical protein